MILTKEATLQEIADYLESTDYVLVDSRPEVVSFTDRKHRELSNKPYRTAKLHQRQALARFSNYVTN